MYVEKKTTMQDVRRKNKQTPTLKNYMAMSIHVVIFIKAYDDP